MEAPADMAASKTLTLEIICKLPGRASRQQVRLPGGATVKDLLQTLGLAGAADDLIVVYAGESVTLDETLDKDGTVMLLPVICGG